MKRGQLKRVVEASEFVDRVADNREWNGQNLVEDDHCNQLK